MRKLGTILVGVMLALACLCMEASAQVTLSSQPGPNFSLTNSVFPTYRYPLATVTGNGTAKFNIGSVAYITCRVTGTYTVATTQVQLSNDGANFSTVVTISTNGMFSIAAGGGLTQLQLSNVGTFTGTSQVFNCSGSTTDMTTFVGDPCQSNFVTKKSVSIAISTATTTQLVALSAGQTIYPCELSIVIGASTTAQLETGATATCGTPAALSGVVPASTFYVGFGGTFVQVPQGQPVCILSTGTGGINGTFTYVIQ